MPHALRLCAEVLEVEDATGRLRSELEEVSAVTSSEWSVEDIERLYVLLVDMTTGLNPPPVMQGRRLFMADVLMLRELVHHGQPQEIRLT